MVMHSQRPIMQCALLMNINYNGYFTQWLRITQLRNESQSQTFLRNNISIFGKLSFRQTVRSAKCPFGKTSVRQNVRRQNVRSAKCLSAKCLSAKCLSAKCPGTYHTIPYHTIPYHTIPYHTIPYHTIPYHTIPYHTIVLLR